MIEGQSNLPARKVAVMALERISIDHAVRSGCGPGARAAARRRTVRLLDPNGYTPRKCRISLSTAGWAIHHAALASAPSSTRTSTIRNDR